ncbi:MAG: ABC transporter permease [Candidatus Schekmanbacteria bacterium]|nr:ABC transporter permease [Candidatus Schekmanbacteria bacterium]
MYFLINIRLALSALRINKLRSFLTMLGIIIGVGAVIALVIIGNGAKTKLAQTVESLGTNILIVRPGSVTSGGARMGMGSTPTLTLDDAKAIRDECSAVSGVAPQVRAATQVVYSNLNWNTVVMGITPDMLDLRTWEISEGRKLLQSDIDGSAKVCILGKTVVDNLFVGEDPIGKIIRINKTLFTIIGVLEPKGQNLMGEDQDDLIYIPLSTAQKRIVVSQFPNVIGIIMVQAVSGKELKAAEQQINDLLIQRHHIGGGKEQDFIVVNLAEMAGVATKMAATMSLLLGAIASISLLVGGIGIMNIMLVSVTERTREIGIRMAIGAKDVDILFQFLTEAVVLSLVGGFIGTVFGVSISAIVSGYLKWPLIISANAIVLAFTFSAGVGIFFGFYPAKRASQLNPIEALRYE